MGKTMDYFVSWLNNSVVYQRQKSKDGAGDIDYASDVILPCYIYGQTQVVINDKGEEVVSLEHVILDGSNATVAIIDFTGRIIIDNRNRKIQAMEKLRDEDGNLDVVILHL